MIRLNAAWLAGLGFPEDLPAEEIQRLLDFSYERLETAVGTQLASTMSSDLLDEFEVLIAGGDEAAALRWLTQHRPDYPKIVESRFGVLAAELIGAAPGLVAEIRRRCLAET